MLTKKLSELTVKELLVEADGLIMERILTHKPAVAMFKAPCQCGDPSCPVTYSVQITPITEVVYDALQEIQ